MATHNYVILSLSHLAGDNAVITGTVDNIPVTVGCSFSAIPLATALGFENFIAPLMLAQAFPAQPAAVVPPISIFTI